MLHLPSYSRPHLRKRLPMELMVMGQLRGKSHKEVGLSRRRTPKVTMRNMRECQSY